MISSEAPQSGLANLMAMKGRYGDTELVHMSRPEVQGLASLGKVTINPDTGLPEAFKLGGIFKTIIPMATTAIGGFLGGPMGAAAGNALGQFAMGERDIGKLALGAMMTYGMGAMSASSGSAAAGASSSVTAAGNTGAATASQAARAGVGTDGLNAAWNSAPAVSQVAPYTPPSPSFGGANAGWQSAASPNGFDAYLSPDAIPYTSPVPSAVTQTALQAPAPQTYNITEGSEGFLGFGKYKPGNNLTASDMAKRGITTIKTPDGDYISASDMGMKGTDYAKAHFSSPSTLIGGGLSAISNGVFEEEYPEYKESERIPFKPKNLKLIADPNTGKHRYIEIPDEEAQQSRFAAEGGLIGLANGGSVSNSTSPLAESLDGLQSLGSTSVLKPTTINNSGLTLEELGGGKHRYNRNVPLAEPVVEAKAVKEILGNPSDNAEDGTDMFSHQNMDPYGMTGKGLSTFWDGDPRTSLVPSWSHPARSPITEKDIAIYDAMKAANQASLSEAATANTPAETAQAVSMGIDTFDMDYMDEESATSGSSTGSSDGSGSASNEGQDEGNDIATGGLVGLTNSERKNVQYLADGGIVSLAEGKRPVSEKDSKNKNSFNLKDFNSIIELGVGYPELKKMLDGETAASKSIAKRLTATNPDSGAKGIFQFIPDVAKDLGTSTAKIEKMTVKEQADLYAKYLKWWKYKPGTPLGMMQAAPAHANKPDDFIVYKKGSEAFKQNHGWIGDDGEITVGSIKRYYNPVKRPRPKDKPAELLEDSGLASIDPPTFDNRPVIKKATGGGIGGYFEGQVDGRGNGMSDEIPFEVEGNDPDKALLSRDEYVIPADAVAMLGNGSSNGGAERLDQFIKQLRTQSFGTQEQQQPIERQQGLSGLI